MGPMRPGCSGRTPSPHPAAWPPGRTRRPPPEAVGGDRGPSPRAPPATWVLASRASGTSSRSGSWAASQADSWTNRLRKSGTSPPGAISTRASTSPWWRSATLSATSPPIDTPITTARPISSRPATRTTKSAISAAPPSGSIPSVPPNPGRSSPTTLRSSPKAAYTSYQEIAALSVPHHGSAPRRPTGRRRPRRLEHPHPPTVHLDEPLRTPRRHQTHTRFSRPPAAGRPRDAGSQSGQQGEAARRW